jgi:O-antigen ligase
MEVIRIRQPKGLRSLDVVLICLLAVTVGGSSLLLSAAESNTLVDGAIEWHAESPLRAVVQLLCLDYRLPTIHAGAVKIYLLGIGAGLSILALTIAVAASRRTDEEDVDTDVPAAGAKPADKHAGAQGPGKAHVAPLVAAQLLVALYLLWSLASSRWSAAPELAVGGSALLIIHALWAYGLGNGLGAAGARVASRILVMITALTAVTALWYYYGRNPTLRAKFPFGNPNFLAACLIPGLLLAGTFCCERLIVAVRTKRARPVGAMLLALVVIALGLWTFYLTGSRGPAVGLAFGALAAFFFGLRKWWKLAPTVVAFAVAVAGWQYYTSAQDRVSPTGRDVTLRVRDYAWRYAWEMYGEKPFTGHGQGGFVLAGDPRAVRDVMSDPEPFEARIAHAHSEWLEVMADLGSVGLVLIAAGLLLTLRAGALALDGLRTRAEYWVLLGLMAALVGLTVEEATGVGLRVSGVGTWYFTVIGLIWALSAHRLGGLTVRLAATPTRRVGTAVVGGAIGLVALICTQADFSAARSSYRARESLQRGEYEEAVGLAKAAQNRLNPQRALANMLRLAEAHLYAAQDLQRLALDRDARARAEAVPDDRLRELAEQNYEASDQHCSQGFDALKALVSRSPGYFSHGQLEYLLYLTRARNAAARGDPRERDLNLSYAAMAIERELTRQPFNPAIALDFARIAVTSADAEAVLVVLARPLRYEGINREYVDLLGPLAADPEFDAQLELTMAAARRAIASPGQVEELSEEVTTWAPEILRLAATVCYMRGEYDRARENLELAATAYDTWSSRAPLGAASCYAELADSRFFHTPDDPQAALESAARAIAMATESLPGRLLQQKVERRMIHYHLAAEEEDAALELLRKSAPPGVTEQGIMQELALRYRALSESLLQRREAGVLRKPPQDMLGKLQRWVHRSIVLRPDDALNHYLAADLTFYAGADEAAATHLTRALELGLTPEAALQFLQVALDERPDSAPLKALWSMLQSAQPSVGARGGQAPTYPEPPAPAEVRQP